MTKVINRLGERQRAGMKGGESMGQIYPVNSVGTLVFDNITFSSLTSFNSAQRNAYDIVIGRGTVYDVNIVGAIATDIPGSYWGVYVSGNSYSVGTNFNSGIYLYDAYHNSSFSSCGVSKVFHDTVEVVIGSPRPIAGLPGGIVPYSSESELRAALSNLVRYPITYHYTNSTVSGPAEAIVGDTVTISAIPDVGYGITDASTQILVTSNDIAVPYTWDATNNRITFTMPNPT